MQDITIVCKDCGEEFVFTTGEQEFFEKMGFTNQPVRCKKCKQERKNRMNNNN